MIFQFHKIQFKTLPLLCCYLFFLVANEICAQSVENKIDQLNYILIDKIETVDNVLILLDKNDKLYSYNGYDLTDYNFDNILDIYAQEHKLYVKTNKYIYQCEYDNYVIEKIDSISRDINTENWWKNKWYEIKQGNDYLTINNSNEIDIPFSQAELHPFGKDLLLVEGNSRLKILKGNKWINYVVPSSKPNVEINRFAISFPFIASFQDKFVEVFNVLTYDVDKFTVEGDIAYATVSADGIIFYGSNGEINVEARNSTIQFIPRLAYLKINGKNVETGSRTLIFDDFIDIELQFDYRNLFEEKANIYVMVEGMDNEWKAWTGIPQKYSLGNGDYTVKWKHENDIFIVQDLKIEKDRITQYLYILIGAILSLLTAAVFALLNNKRKLNDLQKEVIYLKTRNKLLKTEDQVLKLKMNPHFLFNALNNIMGLISSNKVNKARSQLRVFALLMRETLDFSDLNEISVQEDAAFIDKYLRLEQMNHDFIYTIDVDKRISESMLPPMLVQILAENAIKYGAKAQAAGQGVVKINYYLENSHLKVDVVDNGKASTLSHENHKSQGLDIVRNKLKRINGRLEVMPILENNLKVGFKSSIIIPADR